MNEDVELRWWVFGRAAWFRMPLEFRRRWWAATEYGKRCPPLDLYFEVFTTLYGVPLRA